MDDQTVQQRVDALLATAGEVHDLGDFFFEHHPSPDEIQAIHDEASCQEVVTKCHTLIETLRVLIDRGHKHYAHRSFSIVWQPLLADRSATTEEVIYCLVRNAMATMAKAQEYMLDILPALTKRDKLLKFFLWIIRGRKDEDDPLKAGACKHLENHEDRHTFLPSSKANCGDCTHCGKPGAEICCNDCAVVADGNWIFGMYYCSPKCVEADSDSHKKVCSEVRALRRGTKMFSVLYVETLRQCCETDLEELSPEGSIVTARYGTLDKRTYLGTPLFRGFPTHLADSVAHGMMVLTNSHCRDAFTTGEMLLEMLVRPASALVEEVMIQPKNMHKTVLLVQGQCVMFNSLYRHHPLRITLPCGLQFAFDPTAAQYGWKEIIAPWEAYLKHRAHNSIRDVVIKEPVSMGEAWALAKARANRQCDAPINEAASHFRRQLLEHVAMEFSLGAAKHLNMFEENVVSVLQTSLLEDAFELVWKILFRQVQVATADYMRKKEERGIGKLYFDFDMQPHFIQKEETYRRLRKFWFTEDEYAAYKSAQRRERAWKGRLKKAFKGSKIED